MGNDGGEAMEVAYKEMSSFVDEQMEYTENLDQELLTLMKFMILLTAVITPLFKVISRPDNIMKFELFLPWLVLSAIVLIYTTWLSAQGYRNGIYYGGFEDSPFLNFESVTNVAPVHGSWDDINSDIEFPRSEEFYKRLLHDYSIGITHNNWEISYKTYLVQNVFELITLSVAIIIIGVIMSIYPEVGPLGDLDVHTIVFIETLLVVVYQTHRSWETYKDFKNRGEIKGRLTPADFNEH